MCIAKYYIFVCEKQKAIYYCRMSFRGTIDKAKAQGYYVTILFFWLESIALAIKRVQNRVSEGGHFIPEALIKRRYNSGIKNLFGIYYNVADLILIYDNSISYPELLLEKEIGKKEVIYDQTKINTLKMLNHE